VSLKKGIFRLLKFDNIVDALSGYLERKFELLKIELKEDVAKIVSRIIILSVAMLILFMLLLFASFLLATYLNFIFGNNYMGFGIVSLFYLSMFLLLILFKNKLNLEKGIEEYLLKILNKEK